MPTLSQAIQAENERLKQNRIQLVNQVMPMVENLYNVKYNQEQQAIKQAETMRKEQLDLAKMQYQEAQRTERTQAQIDAATERANKANETRIKAAEISGKASLDRQQMIQEGKEKTATTKGEKPIYTPKDLSNAKIEYSLALNKRNVFAKNLEGRVRNDPSVIKVKAGDNVYYKKDGVIYEEYDKNTGILKGVLSSNKKLEKLKKAGVISRFEEIEKTLKDYDEKKFKYEQMLGTGKQPQPKAEATSAAPQPKQQDDITAEVNYFLNM